MTNFSDLSLPEPLLRAARDLNYQNPTPIQEEVIPWLLDNDKDLIALAQTGTGKTAAFGFPALALTDVEKLVVQTLILCPTRELCMQIAGDLQSYGKHMPRIKSAAIYGGAPIYPQKQLIKAGLHIVIGTPGRVNDMIRQNVLHLDQVKLLILDEADEMLNMGFKEELFTIMEQTPKEKQSLLFSATMPKEVAHLARSFMKEPHQISVDRQNLGLDNIRHLYYKVQAKDKYQALKRVADISPKIYGIIFCRTRIETQEIADKLQQDGYNADALHGDLSQGQRELVMNRFRTKYVRLLVATDVAARGLDVDDLTHIINYNVPTDPDVYIHRSGRTGRAGKSGISISIIHHRELAALKAVEKRLGKEITYTKAPGGREICEKQLYHFVDTVERIEVNSEEIESFLPNVYKKLSWLSREELIQRFVSVEFNRFLNYYKDISDLDHGQEERPKREGKFEKKEDCSFKTFQLNIGLSHGLTKRDLMRYINQLKVSRSIEIGQIDIYQDHCLIDIDGQFERQLLEAMSKFKYKGLTLTVSTVQKPPRKSYSRSGSKSEGSYSRPGGKSEGGYSRPGGKSEGGYSRPGGKSEGGYSRSGGKSGPGSYSRSSSKSSDGSYSRSSGKSGDSSDSPTDAKPRKNKFSR